MSCTPENHDNYKKTIKDRGRFYHIKVEKSRDGAKWLIKPNDKAFTDPPKMIMNDYLK